MSSFKIVEAKEAFVYAVVTADAGYTYGMMLYANEFPTDASDEDILQAMNDKILKTAPPAPVVAQPIPVATKLEKWLQQQIELKAAEAAQPVKLGP